MSNSPFLGQLMLFGGTFAPHGYALCQGQLLSISQNAALFALLGTQFGGNGVNTFGLPDLRGAVPGGQGTGNGLSPYVMGMKWGSESVTLLAAQMPGHQHTVSAATGQATSANPAGNVPAAGVEATPATKTAPATSTPLNVYTAPGTLTPLASTSMSAAGSSLPHENRQPFLTLNWCIALQGIFPSRN